MRIFKSVTTLLLALIVVAACASSGKQAATSQPAAAPATPPPPPPAAQPASTEKPAFTATATDTMSAVVAAIDYDTREVTLTDDAGDTVSFVAGDDVQNLAQVEVGDVLTVEVLDTISVQVVPGDGEGPSEGEMVAAARAEAGQKPGGAAMGATVIVAVIQDIDYDTGDVVLLGPDGTLSDYQADPANLTNVDIGDNVVITVSEAFSISVDSPN